MGVGQKSLVKMENGTNNFSVRMTKVILSRMTAYTENDGLGRNGLTFNVRNKRMAYLIMIPSLSLVPEICT